MLTLKCVLGLRLSTFVHNLIDLGGWMTALLSTELSDLGLKVAVPNVWVSVDEAACFLGVKKSWLYNSGDKYGVPCSKIGNHRRYNLKQLDEYMRANALGAASPNNNLTTKEKAK